MRSVLKTGAFFAVVVLKNAGVYTVVFHHRVQKSCFVAGETRGLAQAQRLTMGPKGRFLASPGLGFLIC